MSVVSQAIDPRHQNVVSLECVDVFQGIVLTQLFVGLPLVPATANLSPSWFREAVNQQLHPSIWHGLTWVDFGFAAFVMTMGLKISLEFRLQDEAIPIRSQYPQILRFTAFLFFLGLIANGALTQRWSDIRVVGTLQRMAICYLVGSVIYLKVPKRIRYAFVPAILIGYWLLLAYVPAADGKAGDYTFDGNLAAWVDQQFLPGRHYYGKWDPEGILTTVPAIASCLIGTIWGDLLVSRFRSNTKLFLFIVGGVVAMNLGALSESYLPINRSLWTSSYVLVTAGIGTILLGVSYFVVDVMHEAKWLFPFVVIGRNFLFAFFLIELFPFGPLVGRLRVGNMAFFLGRSASFFQALIEILSIWLVLYGCYRYQSITKAASYES